MDLALFSRNSIFVFIIYVLILFVLYRKGERKKLLPWHIAGCILFCIWVEAIATATGVTPLSGFHLKISLRDINWNLIGGIADMLGQDPVYSFLNLAGNIILFIPFGFCLPLLCRGNRSLGRVTLYGFLYSLAIETWQLFLLRGTDVVDLFLNTLGAVIGYLIFLAIQRLLPRFIELFSSTHRSMKKTEQTELLIAVILPTVFSILIGFVDCVRYGILGLFLSR